VFPAIAYQQVAAQGRIVSEADVHRVIDAVLLPALGATPQATSSPRASSGATVPSSRQDQAEHR